jgi:4-amino-4-deoxy-L-arabinose transferase-like glycosyltransferase
MRWLRLLLVVNAVALLAVAVWMRCRQLGNMPGLNGDEAWYGVQALQLLRGEDFALLTPSRLPVNPLFFGPVLLTHCFLPPSFELLRCVAMTCGVLTLGVNYVLIRWVWDRRTALFSTLVLAVLPVNIIYSRLAWDSCLSVAATLMVLCLAMVAVRRGASGSSLLTASAAFLSVAMLVHPTNLFMGAALVPAVFMVRGDLVARGKALWKRIQNHWQGAAWSGLVALLLLVALLACAVSQPRSRKVVDVYLQRVAHWMQPETLAHTVRLALVGYPRLFIGGTVYRFTAGTGSTLEWPAKDDSARPGADVVLFWILLAGAGWLTWRSARTTRRPDDWLLLITWGLELVGFLVVAGGDALRPHHERYALCLVAPTVLLVSRAALLIADKGRGALAIGGVVAALAGWLLLADFQQSFFAFLRHTGGRTHLAFSTAEHDPKQAALQYILGQRQSRYATWIVASTWWTYWPMRYLALGQPGVFVVQQGAAETDPDYRQSLAAGRVWRVVLSRAERPIGLTPEKTLAHRCFRDYAGHPVVHVFRVAAAGSPQATLHSTPQPSMEHPGPRPRYSVLAQQRR